MTRNLMIGAITAFGLVAAPSAAQLVGGNVGAGVGANVGAQVAVPPAQVGVGAQQGVGADVGVRDGQVGATARIEARTGAQGAVHASPDGEAHAQQHSALAGDTVVVGPLAGLSIGMEVHDRDGVRLGEVERIVPAAEHRIENVLVRTADGRIVPLAPTNVTLSGGVAVATDFSAAAGRTL